MSPNLSGSPKKSKSILFLPPFPLQSQLGDQKSSAQSRAPFHDAHRQNAFTHRNATDTVEHKQLSNDTSADGSSACCQLLAIADSTTGQRPVCGGRTASAIDESVFVPTTMRSQRPQQSWCLGSPGLFLHFMAVHRVRVVSVQRLGHSVAFDVPIPNDRKHQQLALR